MRRSRGVFLVIASLTWFVGSAGGSEPSPWSFDAGVRFFKYSSEGGPNEIQYNPVFSRWERISQDADIYETSDYEALTPLYFNMSFGVDLFIRYKNRLLIKLGYDYSNPFGIGGSGHIAYRELATGATIFEEKEFSYTSHQLNYFIGPLFRMGENGGEVYLGFSPMSPTWVTYDESFRRTVDGAVDTDYDRAFEGFFGNCRGLLGIQVPVGSRLRAGSEMVFSFLNYMALESGDLADKSFQFPNMKWDFTIRYALK